MFSLASLCFEHVRCGFLQMELKPRPVEVDQFLELDEHLLNRNGVTAVTADSRTPATNALPASSEEVSGGSGITSGVQAVATRTGLTPEQQQIVRIVIS